MPTVGVLSLGLAACGGGTTTVTTSASTTPATSTTSSATESLQAAWAGTWTDTEDAIPTNFVIRVEGGQPQVVSASHASGQTHEVTGSHWNGSRLSWTYHNAETGTSVTYNNCVVAGARMSCSWHNTTGSSGSVMLQR